MLTGRQSFAHLPMLTALKKHEPCGTGSVLTGRKLYKKRDFWYAVKYGFELECARRMLRRLVKYAAAAGQVSGKARCVSEGMEQKEEKYAAAKRKTGGDADRASE